MGLQQLLGAEPTDLAAAAQDAQVLPRRSGVDCGGQHGVLPSGGGYNSHALPGRCVQCSAQPGAESLMVIQKGSPIQIHGQQGNLHKGHLTSQNTGRNPDTAYHLFPRAATCAGGIAEAAGHEKGPRSVIVRREMFNPGSEQIYLLCRHSPPKAARVPPAGQSH